MRVLLLANFDSGLKYAGRVADAVAALGAEPDIRIPTTVVPHRLGAEQVAAATRRPVRYEPWPALVRAAAEADAVVPVFEGPTVERFIREVHAAAGDRMPVVGTGYVGMVLYDVVGGYLSRSLADVLAVNSRTDLAEFRGAARGLGLPEENLLLAGLALLPATPQPLRDGPIRTMLFADQPTVPRRAADRVHLWDRVLGYAQQHPDRRVLLRPRHRPGEDTFHTMEHSPVAWAATRTLPSNLVIEHAPIDGLIPESDLLVTVSSTAALEAIAAGTRVAFVADWVNDAALNPRLLPSGLLRRFDDIDADRLGSPDPTWIEDVFPAAEGPSPAERFAARLLAVAAGDAPRVHQALWDSSFHAGRRATDAALAAPATSRWTPRRVAAGVLRRALRLVER
ncbi:DUF6716 putative glycosyltransferase [Amnibacterium setariae]|uniref:Uncharacterized protein n=1 Tax=Amnibacterium setariae TaxID=2306585 RepID=A0A3A1U222_9MICO|nr:DUF6716 putative glycosyltransferase [Amnibacterium setariae]RIX30423.1 hypothetical protein D1781_03040 [Amnibacterium setariae]